MEDETTTATDAVTDPTSTDSTTATDAVTTPSEDTPADGEADEDGADGKGVAPVLLLAGIGVVAILLIGCIVAFILVSKKKKSAE